MGRPPLPKSKLRRHAVLVKLADAEIAAIRRAAGRVPLAAWMRALALRAARNRRSR
jgi:hypothetical protein